MKRIAIFASGNGSNFQRLVDAQKEGLLIGEISLLVSDNPGAYVNIRAKNDGIPAFSFDPKKYSSKEDYESVIIEVLQEMNIDYLVLAGYMRLVGTTILNGYTNRILNLHPSLLPSFQGKNAIQKAMEYGVKVTGVTVHFVDEGMDTGPIILQDVIAIGEDDSLESLTSKIHQIEHKLLLDATNLVLAEKVVVSGRRVMIKGEK